MKEARNIVASLGLKISSLRPVTQDCHLPNRMRIYQQQIKRNNFSPMNQRHQNQIPMRQYYTPSAKTTGVLSILAVREEQRSLV